MTTPFTPGADGGVFNTQFLASAHAAGAAGTYTFNLDLDTYMIVLNAYSAIKLDGAGVWTANINGGSSAQYDDGVNGLGGNGLAFVNYLSTANSKVVVGTEGTLAG